MRPSLLPFTGWPRPDPPLLRADLVAGASVAVVAIPQALAYAQLAGVPPHLGLYAAFVPTVVAAAFGSSAQLSTGPVALTSLLTAASLSAFAHPGSAAYLALAVLLALGSGLIQAVAGLARIGRVIDRLPPSLMLGFVNAAALVIILSQLPAMVGAPSVAGGGPVRTAVALVTAVGELEAATAGFGVASLAALLVLRRARPLWPSALIVSVAAIVVSGLVGYEARGPVVGALPGGLPTPSLPRVEAEAVLTLLPAMALIALVSFIEVTSSARVIAARTGVPWNVNQELVGQGLAKIAAAGFGAFPVSGSFSRSALNLAAGARSPWASLVCASLVGGALLFAAGALYHLPKAVLAALIVSAVLNLVTPREMLGLVRADRHAAAIAWTTLVATLLAAPQIHYGLLAGLVAVGLLALVARSTGSR